MIICLFYSWNWEEMHLLTKILQVCSKFNMFNFSHSYHVFYLTHDFCTILHWGPIYSLKIYFFHNYVLLYDCSATNSIIKVHPSIPKMDFTHLLQNLFQKAVFSWEKVICLKSFEFPATLKWRVRVVKTIYVPISGSHHLLHYFFI